MLGKECAALVCLMLFTACEGGVDSPPSEDEDRAILSGTLEAIRVEDKLATVPLDTRLLPAHPDGGILPPGSDEHVEVPDSPLLREIASRSKQVQLIERSHIYSAELVVSLGVPVRTSATSADVHVALSNPAEAHVTYWRYSMTRGGDGVWRLAGREYLSAEG